MERQARNLHFISSFRRLNSKQRKAVLEHLDFEQVKFICEICHNLLKENIPLETAQLEKLRPHQKKIRYLAEKGPIKEKKRILMTGGFLPSLLLTIAGTLLPLLIQKFSNAKREN